jgi:acetyl-CoA acetyltransferase
MRDRRLADTAVISGIGQTEFSGHSGRTELRLALEAILACIEDAGITPRDIDGFVRFGSDQTGCAEVLIASNLGVPRLRYWSEVDFGGSSGCAIVGHAAAAVATGLANYVVCFRSINGRSGTRLGSWSETHSHDPAYANFILPHGLTAPTQFFALLARRYMHQYGATSEQLGHVAVSFRAKANNNPRAQMYGVPLTLAQYFAAEMISTPLRKYDCCLQTDGAVALLVTTPERARDLKQLPVFIKAAAQATAPDLPGPLMSAIVSDLLARGSGRNVAEEVYEQSGLLPRDIDVAQLNDSFTIAVLLQLEEFGFCNAGEAGEFVANGCTDLGGALPLNTSGGHLSDGYFQGVSLILEGVRQMRGTSANQVPNAQTCLVTSGSPLPASALIIGRDSG